jgi:hypothetical protein
MPLKAVYEFAEQVTEPGFVFMDTPGYDPVAVTGQVAGGCNVICFTTGRGSVSGFKPSPCIKIATNSEMAAQTTVICINLFRTACTPIFIALPKITCEIHTRRKTMSPRVRTMTTIGM